MRLAGIDGCKGGWVAVEADAGRPSSARLTHVTDLAAFLAQTDFALVDMPIGFASGPASRDVETAMRAAIRGKASSVFPTPCRMALAELFMPTPLSSTSRRSANDCRSRASCSFPRCARSTQ